MTEPMTVKRGDGSWSFPRRSCIDQLIPAELAIRSAIGAVESLPADERLTEIVIRLTELQDRLADWAEATGNVKPEEEAVHA